MRAALLRRAANPALLRAFSGTVPTSPPGERGSVRARVALPSAGSPREGVNRSASSPSWPTTTLSAEARGPSPPIARGRLPSFVHPVATDRPPCGERHTLLGHVRRASAPRTACRRTRAILARAPHRRAAWLACCRDNASARARRGLSSRLLRVSEDREALQGLGERGTRDARCVAKRVGVVRSCIEMREDRGVTLGEAMDLVNACVDVAYGMRGSFVENSCARPSKARRRRNSV